MSTQFLFAYGTLKSDQPEHVQHCVTPLSIVRAKAPGSLWRLREGYPILQVDPQHCLLDATKDVAADWEQATALQKEPNNLAIADNWIDGELFEYPIDAHSLHKMDTWENFTPGIKSPYQRRVIRIKDENGADRIAWAYVCYSPPNWATMLTENCWNPQSS